MIDLKAMKKKTLKDRGLEETVYFEPGQYVVKTINVTVQESTKNDKKQHFLIIKSEIVDARNGSTNTVGSKVSFARKINENSILDIDNIAQAINDEMMDLNQLKDNPELFEDRYVKVVADKLPTDKGTFTKITFHRVSQEEPKQWNFREVEVELPVKRHHVDGVTWETTTPF